MSETGANSSKPQNDIYTILLAIAALIVLVATVIISIRSQQLFGTWLPLGGGW